MSGGRKLCGPRVVDAVSIARCCIIAACTRRPAAAVRAARAAICFVLISPVTNADRRNL
jgi:hypothetical protein